MVSEPQVCRPPTFFAGSTIRATNKRQVFYLTHEPSEDSSIYISNDFLWLESNAQVIPAEGNEELEKAFDDFVSRKED